MRVIRLSIDPLLATFEKEAATARVEEDANAAGRPLFTLFAGGELRWVVAAPGSELPGRGRRSSPWRWMVHEYLSQRQAEADLTTIIGLLPSVEARVRDLHKRAIGRLIELLEECEEELEAELEPELRRLKREIGERRASAETHGRFECAPRPMRRRAEGARLSWVPPKLALTAEEGARLRAGDERPGRLRAALAPRADERARAVEVEIDVKRSLVTLHSIDERASIEVGGEPLRDKLSIPVVDSEDPAEWCVLRLGRPLGAELERVVSVG